MATTTQEYWTDQASKLDCKPNLLSIADEIMDSKLGKQTPFVLLLISLYSLRFVPSTEYRQEAATMLKNFKETENGLAQTLANFLSGSLPSAIPYR
jgi:hypothetical protein